MPAIDKKYVTATEVIQPLMGGLYMSSICFIEERSASAHGSSSLAADIARHLHARQYLGKAVILCDQPVVMLSTIRKQWLKLARVIQKQRAATLNADKILKYTHAITHMQNMQFTAKAPSEHPGADVYILEGATPHLPPQCWSTYICSRIHDGLHLANQMPTDALIIDYEQTTDWQALGLEPKKMIEQRVRQDWKQAHDFLQNYGVNIDNFYDGERQNVDAIDDALDTLLAVDHKFLSVASEFQRTLELARPLKLSKDIRLQYDNFILLAHRVQALGRSPFTKRFIEIYNEDDTFFLHDGGKRLLAEIFGKNLLQTLERHQKAGRFNLAKALESKAHAYGAKSASLLSQEDNL